MITSTTYRNGILTISVNGRIDSSVAPTLQHELEMALKEHGDDDIKECVIDASKLQYISSMGLRVLLLYRKQIKNIRITGCTSEIFNVFNMTGFTGMITVEKALEEMSIEGLAAIHGISDCYQLTDETMLKIYPAGVTKTDVDREVKLSKTIFKLDIPSPMTFDIVRVGDRMGIILESVATSSDSVSPYTLAKMLRDMHQHIIEPNGIVPSAVDCLKERIHRLEPYLGAEPVAKLLQMLSSLPDGFYLLHGNMSLSKIKLREGEPVFTDMLNVCYGNVAIDLAHLYSTFTENQKHDYFDEFMHSYFSIESEETIRRSKRNVEIFSIISDFTRLVENGEPSVEDVVKARCYFHDRIASRWDEFLSRLHFKIDFNEEICKLERNRFYANSEVSIDWIADKLGTNRHYVSDYFNKVLHTTFNDYVNNKRLDYAVELLRQGRVPATQIAYSVGFNNDHTFRRIFKQRFGCTPSQFEK